MNDKRKQIKMPKWWVCCLGMTRKIENVDEGLLSETIIETSSVREYLDCSKGGNYIQTYIEPELIQLDITEIKF